MVDAAYHAVELFCSPTTAGPGAGRVLKSGSHLWSPEYCLRYRPAARSHQSDDSATTHIGFRCVRDPASKSTAGMPHATVTSVVTVFMFRTSPG
nr:SUMF1/EgtB/PvdO family nonheme iron enzyme [Cryobacterium sp. Y62]